MDKPTLSTVHDAIEALGGVKAVAELTGRSQENVYNWRAANRFSHQTFLKISGALRARGISANPKLWGIEPALDCADMPFHMPPDDPE